ncbi:hypothetical protein [Sphingomonas montanisoli]|uniref:Uncharacterized protein n=1 Tax=Sphingomonas montanisoli TaxID=2606412 RepID=A0A5D9CBA7_9SPHN|nr:hypothetical protein [Sphingomonas montanisoli]TZG29009.1 hypothetical protein FYJ91_02385 [Sphingomonas montanisoli]
MIDSRAIRYSLGATLILATILHAGRLYFEMPTNSIDGAFQTYSAVSAYARGQSLGVDFQSYLGALMPLAIVPIFLVLGKTVFASTASAAMLACAGLYFTFVVLLRLTTQLTKSDAALWAMSATFLGIAGIKLWAMMVLPGVSLKALRFALPFVVALPMWALLTKSQVKAASQQLPLLPCVALGAVIAIASLWSNDAGIPCLIAATTVHATLCFRTLDRVAAITAIATVLASTVTTIVMIVMLLTHGAPADWLHYTFVSTPTDQPWFFPPWSPDERVLGITDILHILKMPTGWTIACCGATACIAGYRLLARQGEAVSTAMVAFIYAATTGIGLLPQLAGHLNVDYGFGTVVPALFAPLWLVPRLGVAATRWLMSRWRVHIACLLALLALAAIAGSVHARLKRGYAYSPTIGAYIDPREADTLATMDRAGPIIARISPDPKDRILSTYFSALSIAAQADSPTRYGSIIHVLGDDARREYVAKIRDTDFALVTTISPESSAWGGWNLRASWFAMKLVVETYEPFAKSAQHIFWKRRETPLPPPAAMSCTVRTIDDGAVELTFSDIAGKAASDGAWYVDVGVRVSHVADRYWIATEVISPAEKALVVSRKNAWVDFPSYGLPPEKQLTLMAEHATGKPTRITLKGVPGPSVKLSGQCVAMRIAPVALVGALPILNDRTLRDALTPRLPHG